MAKALTPITVANLRARAQRYEVSDGGCAGLRVVVFPSKKKSFVLRYRFRGLQRKLTLGPCLVERGVAEPANAPETGTPLSLLAARELATKALREARSGTDPAAAKQRRKQEQLAAESDTLQAIAEEFLRREGPRLRTLSQRRSDLELLYRPLGRLPIDQIRRGQYVRALDHIADHRGPVRADRTLAAVKALLNWHAARSDYVSVLGRGGRRTSIRERARTKTLSDDELRRVWLAAERDNKGPFGPFVRFLLLTCTRRSEAGGLRRSELSEGGTLWTIPAARYKSGRDVVIPLSKAAQKIVAAQPVLAGDYVFSADGSRPLGKFDVRKKELDAASGVDGYVLHDLRRTSRTILSRAGVAADIAEMCLGHAMVGVRGTYDRHAYENEKRRALELLAQTIERVVRPPEPKVADMAVERRKRRR
jgi:integrase